MSIRRVSIDSDGTILATSSNKLIRSTDFGENWTEIEREETSWAYDLSEFANSTVATVDRTLQSPPNNYLAQVSKDNGLTWKTSIFENFISSIHFVNENIGFVGGAGEIFKTTDGGDNWQSVETFTTQSSIHDFHFINEEEGFAVNGEQIFKTNDGGQTWNLEYCKNIHLPKQIFANEETAFVLIRSKLYERIPNPDYDCEDVNSVPQLKEIEIDIYPNPAQNHFQILSELTGSVQIEIRNLNGKILKKSSVLNNAPIDISTIANGLYFVTIKNDNLKKTLRLIKL